MGVVTRDMLSDRSSTYSDAANSAVRTELTPRELQKQHTRILQDLAFLDRIERVKMTSIKQEDDCDFLVFDVIMKQKDPWQNESLSDSKRAKLAKKDAKKTRPLATYSTSKSMKTIKMVHAAIYEWSMKHTDDTRTSCAYCHQFHSPKARALWSASGAPTQAAVDSTTAALTVVVNKSEYRQYEIYLNRYLESALR
uniref:Uncharacterized protein n=1 Tax=Globisporangium ultimum (strain ATCC 200006 / CBS 805.95 / DAOM BR144) TaxID=431595 RepID=K3WE56_GLOUD